MARRKTVKVSPVTSGNTKPTIELFYNNIEELIERTKKACELYPEKGEYWARWSTEDINVWNKRCSLTQEEIYEKTLSGCTEYYNTLKHSTEAIEVSGSNRMYTNDFEGLFIDVNSFLQGLPEIFINEVDVLESPKFINIEVNIGVAGAVSAKDIFKKLSKVFALVERLELSNYRVRIIASCYMTATAVANNISLKVVLKDYQETMAVERLSMLLVSPVLLRFYVLGSTMIENGENSGAGYSDYEKEITYIKTLDDNTIYIPSFYYDKRMSVGNSDNILLCYPHLEKFASNN